jgi:hypothetical protein
MNVTAKRVIRWCAWGRPRMLTVFGDVQPHRLITKRVFVRVEALETVLIG